jgi:pyridoxine 4-dehydrogenase
VNRLGFGAMRLPADPGRARALLRRAVELGVRLIDTAEFYGPGTSERLIAEALHPYPEGLVIATKGLTHPPDRWGGQGHAGRLREAVEGSLRRLRLERIDLYQLARIDPTVPAADQFGVLAELRQQSKIHHVGLSEVGVDQVRAARQLVPVASVQNRYSLADRAWEPVVDHCEHEGIAFCRGSPLVRAGSPRLAERWWPSRGATTPRRPRSPWPGCCGARRSCCRSPARRRSCTWRTTWPPRRCGSPTTSSSCWVQCEQADAAVGRGRGG